MSRLHVIVSLVSILAVVAMSCTQSDRRAVKKRAPKKRRATATPAAVAAEPSESAPVEVSLERHVDRTGVEVSAYTGEPVAVGDADGGSRTPGESVEPQRPPFRQERRMPAGTKATASFGTEKGKGADKLIDGDTTSYMQGHGGTCTSSTQATSVYFRFPAPQEFLAGVVTGSSDRYHNYYPQEMEFHVDSNGDGRYDTLVGRTTDLGPADASKGAHWFDNRQAKSHGLEVRVVEQHVGGGTRAWTMNEIGLVYSNKRPLGEATPVGSRALYYKSDVPEGSSIRASFATEEGGGPEKVLDGDGGTFMNARQGTARPGEAASLYLTFPEPVADLAGVVLGRSGRYGNYFWKRMEFRVDTTGDGRYDTAAGSARGPGGGEKRFGTAVERAHGLELRVTDQSIKGTGRCFSLSEISYLVLRDAAGDTPMRVVVEDFEDFTSWRIWANNTAQPPGERIYGRHSYICGSFEPGRAKFGQGVGLLRYCFKEGGGRMWCTRGDVWKQEGLVDAIRFWANPQGYEGELWFELTDAKGSKQHTPKVTVRGNAWREYEIDLSPKAMPAVLGMETPFRIKMLFFSSKRGGTGDVLLDDISYVGAVSRTRRAAIRRVYDGLAYDPSKPVVARYTVRNAQKREVVAELDARVFSSFEATDDGDPVAAKTTELTLPPLGSAAVTLDFGRLGRGSYRNVMRLTAAGVSVKETDLLAVFTPNGERINESPMWFGSAHHGDWTGDVENAFIVEHIVVPLGLDTYRTGAPDERLVEAGLLCNAGFGGMPSHLRLPGQKNDGRGEPNDYDAYYRWCKSEAREKYLPYKDSIVSIEYYNEPDLPRFCYIPEIDTFLKMHATWRKAFREVMPGVRIGTGSNTVQHGHEKKDFNPRMYRELAHDAEVAVWHAHGALSNYTTRHRMVENWLEEAGLPEDEWLLGNSEAAIPSGYGARGWLAQADNLVKKVGWAKSQRSSLFYSWFVTTDLFDPQHVGGGEDWGLVTTSKRVKPSGQAYNELVRRLANTTGHGEIKLDSRVQCVYFTKRDGSQVWLFWPRERGARFVLPLRTDGAVVLSDMFGRDSRLAPERGKVTFRTNGYPMYLVAPKGVKLAEAGGAEYAEYPPAVAGLPGATLTVPVTFENTWGKDVSVAVALEDETGREVARERFALRTGATAEKTFSIALAQNAPYGMRGYALRVSVPEAGIAGDVLSVSVSVAERAARQRGPFAMDGSRDRLTKPGAITLDTRGAVRELVDDPHTPKWKDANDLSVSATLAHDTKGLYVCMEVEDQRHIPGKPSGALWANDSIQLAVHGDGNHTEIGLTESSGGFGWCWISPRAERVNKKLAAPYAAKRSGGTTVYETYLPFELLGIAYAPGKVVRLTFLLNEDDGRGRVRLMTWFDGIAAGKSVDLFGHLMLE